MKKTFILFSKWFVAVVLIAAAAIFISGFILEHTSVDALEDVLTRMELISRWSLIAQLGIVALFWLKWSSFVVARASSDKKKKQLEDMRHHICGIFAALIILLAV
ncbi:hypothetical protein L1D35_20290 [Vibrio harveyi]|uniref:hypothetical protein n=1 Tax=Vibrio harveyi TaxID=669 RepID=UPI001EFED585|nr:hypothetical protein [Vibrio harveyi]MCG9589949.1 hypothetical protein [Vibrio harveyi]MCG9670352.1 hypothetical protein [Vibrio harveyi]